MCSTSIKSMPDASTLLGAHLSAKPFDVTSASATILPGFFRALGHAWIASHCKGEMSPSGISVRQGNVKPDEILLSHEVYDHGTALAFVNKTIEKLNSGRMAA